MFDPDRTASDPDAGLYKTTDGGDHWQQITTFATGPFERSFMRTVAVHPNNGNIEIILAEYLTFVATALLLPLEVYEIIDKQTPLKIIGFNSSMLEAIAQEMTHIQKLAHAGQIAQGLFVARKRKG